MGYWPLGLAETGKSLLLTAILFSGPLFETLLVDGAWTQWLSLYPVTSLFSEWTRWRNLVAVRFTTYLNPFTIFAPSAPLPTVHPTLLLASIMSV